MATIGSLAVNIVANTNKFVSGLKSAQTSLGKFVSGISAAQGIIGGFSTLAIARMASDVIQAGDAINDLSAKLNIGTAQLGALQYAAEQLGSSTEAMNTGLQFLNKNIGLLQQGSDSATKSFGMLHLQATDLVGLTLDQRFLKVADAIKKLGTDTEQAAAAQQIFGKGGQALLPIIREGTNAIIAQGEAAAKTGSLFSEDQAAQMNATADAIKNMTAAWQGLKISLIEGFGPAITTAVNGLAEFMRLFREAQFALEGSLLQGVANNLGYDVSAEKADLQRRRSTFSGQSGTGPLSSSSNGGKGVQRVHIVKDDTQDSDTVTLGTAGIR